MPSLSPPLDWPSGALSGLLRTVGLARGPQLLHPYDAAQAVGDAVGDAEDALAWMPGMRMALLHPALQVAMAGAFGDDPGLLSRADLVVLNEDQLVGWQRAGGRLTRHATPLRAVLGVTFLLPLTRGAVQACAASTGLHASPGGKPEGVRLCELVLGPGETAAVRLGMAYHISAGIWFRLDFVRCWMKPDIMFSEALPAADEWPPHVRSWLGADISLPSSLKAFLEAEAAAVRGDLGNVHGRGV